MDKEFEININDKKAVKYLKILIITLLAVIEIIVCAQYIEMYAQNGDIARLAAVVICSAILTTLVAVDSFIKSSFPVKMMLFGFDSAFLLAICIDYGQLVSFCAVLSGADAILCFGERFEKEHDTFRGKLFFVRRVVRYRLVHIKLRRLAFEKLRADFRRFAFRRVNTRDTLRNNKLRFEIL